MQFGIRLQLLFPLVPMVLGLTATTAWTAYSAAAAARQRIFAELSNIADSLQKVTFEHNSHTLKLIKGLSGAELILKDRRAIPQLQTTLSEAPPQLPDDLGETEPSSIRIGGV